MDFSTMDFLTPIVQTILVGSLLLKSLSKYPTPLNEIFISPMSVPTPAGVVASEEASWVPARNPPWQTSSLRLSQINERPRLSRAYQILMSTTLFKAKRRTLYLVFPVIVRVIQAILIGAQKSQSGPIAWPNLHRHRIKIAEITMTIALSFYRSQKCFMPVQIF